MMRTGLAIAGEVHRTRAGGPSRNAPGARRASELDWEQLLEESAA